MREKIIFIQKGRIVPFTDNKMIVCNKLKRSAPKLETDFVEQDGSDGLGDGTTVFSPFSIECEFTLFHDNVYDREIREQELFSKIYQREAYYLVREAMPGMKYLVYPEELNTGEIYNTHTEYTLSFNVFQGCSESLGSTLNPREVSFDTWQFQQGLLADDYEYTFNHSIFSVYNLGDFDVDPREHYLKILIKGEADGGLQLYNRTTRERFIFNQSLDKNKDDTLEINGVYTYKNGVLSGIDTNGELITLKSGKNNIELFGVGSPEISFDFHFRHK